MSYKKRLDKCPRCGGPLLADFKEFVGYALLEGVPRKPFVRVTPDPEESGASRLGMPERVVCADEGCGREIRNLLITREGVLSAQGEEKEATVPGQP